MRIRYVTSAYWTSYPTPLAVWTTLPSLDSYKLVSTNAGVSHSCPYWATIRMGCAIKRSMTI